jgi:lysophospholipase L1-like esterase
MNINRFDLLLKGLILLFLVYGCTSKNPVALTSINIPQISSFKIDGETSEWEKVQSTRLWANPLGGYADISDLDASFKASWNENSLLLLFEVTDQNYLIDTLNPWKADAIEVFLSPKTGSDEILQISVSPSSEKDFIRIENHSEENNLGIITSKIKSFTKFSGNKRLTEIEIPFTKKQKINGSLALQLYVDDADTGRTGNNQVVWYPVGHSYNSSFSMFTVSFSENETSIQKATSRIFISDNEKVILSVFGANKSDQVVLYRNGKFLTNLSCTVKPAFQPDTFDISTFIRDIENDSLFVTVNGVGLCLHELFLSPRIFVNLKERRFDQDIRNFILKDRMSFPPSGASLFIGSSSIVRWQTLKRDFPELQIIQRGFGGSVSSEVLMYINQIVLPYKPSKIVYYEGDNDIVMGLSAEEIRDNVRSFIDKVNEILPETRMYILSPKPSIKRMHLWETYKKTHLLLKELSGKYANVKYIDVASPMFDEEGKLNYSLFVEDGIHMNDAGYSIWTKVIRNALELK